MPSTAFVQPNNHEDRHMSGSFAAWGATGWSPERFRPRGLPELLPVGPLALEPPRPPAPSFSVGGLHGSTLPARHNGGTAGARNPGPLLCGLAILGLACVGCNLLDGTLLAARLSRLLVGGTAGCGGGTWALQLLPRLPGWEAVFRSVLEGFTRAFSSETAAFLGAALGRAVGVVAHVAAMMGGACVARALAERWGGQEAGWQGWAH